jgi:hypothetical protein
MAKEGMDLSSGSAHSSLVNVLANQCNDGSLRVLPGDPGQSYLMDKLLGMNLCFGSKMPKMRTLPRGDIEAISTWICTGAPNN